MEFLILVCSSTLQDEILNYFEAHRITGFTRLEQATGAGKGGGTRMNDEIWPGENAVFMVALAGDKAAGLKKWVRSYRSGPLREGLKLFTLPLTEVI